MALYGGIRLPERPDVHNIQRLDLLPLPMIAKMHRYGMRIDVDAARALSSKFQSDMLSLKRDIANVIPPSILDKFVDAAAAIDEPDEQPYITNNSASPAATALLDTEDDARANRLFNIESSQKIASLLYDHLHLHLNLDVKIKKTKSGDRLSTGKKTLEQLKRKHPVVQLILNYREIAKLDSTYARALPLRATLHPKGKECPVCGRRHYSSEYRIHTQILTTRTETGRTASKKPNLANIPARSELGRLIRALFIASEGCVISQRDFSQIELRLGADRSGDEDMIRIYRANGDIHVDTAMRAFNKTYEEVTSDEGKLNYRAPCKNVNFAVFYLISGDGLLDLMASTYATAGKELPAHIDKRWCEQFIEIWFGLYRGVKRYLMQEESKIRRYGIAWTAAGRVRRIPEARSYHPYIQAAGVRQGSNHGIQGYSADIMKLAMGELDARLNVMQDEYLIPSYPLMTVYDELLIEAAEDDAYTIQELTGEVMDNVLVDKNTGVLQCKVPIVSEGKLMTAWKK